MSNEYLEKELLELPDKIEKKQRQIIVLKDNISKEERSKKFIEIGLRRDIFKEQISIVKDDVETKKQKFSSEKTRDSELYIRMHNDEKAVTVQTIIEELNGDLAIMIVELERLNNDFRARKSMAIIAGGK